ncbi:hypothetical protein [Proteus terrae]|uniref:hypothetical protein n=1 Tax=Proteus terrae TaxID=1574161 RepID=UPI00288BC365|nr:hypothetical protein [Proteus terrae]
MHKYEWCFIDKNGKKHSGEITHENRTYVAGDGKFYDGKNYKIENRIINRSNNKCDLHIAVEI